MSILFNSCRPFSISPIYYITLNKLSQVITSCKYGALSFTCLTKFLSPATNSNMVHVRTFKAFSSGTINQQPDIDGPKDYTNLVNREFLSLDELVQLLRSMNALDIAVLRSSSTTTSPDDNSQNEYNSRLVQSTAINGPGEHAAHLLLVAGGRSSRHMQAIHNAVIALYKSKRSSRNRWRQSRDWSALRGPLLANNPKKMVHSTDWYALALVDVLHEEQRVNAHLHLMTERARRRYELETLWACGRLYDDAFERERRILDALGVRGASGDLSAGSSTSRLLDLWSQLDAANKRSKQT